MDKKEDDAYAMQRAYRETMNRPEAIARVKQLHPDVPVETLDAMWRAIDAYADMTYDLP